MKDRDTGTDRLIAFTESLRTAVQHDEKFRAWSPIEQRILLPFVDRLPQIFQQQLSQPFEIETIYTVGTAVMESVSEEDIRHIITAAFSDDWFTPNGFKLITKITKDRYKEFIKSMKNDLKEYKKNKSNKDLEDGEIDFLIGIDLGEERVQEIKTGSYSLEQYLTTHPIDFLEYFRIPIVTTIESFYYNAAGKKVRWLGGIAYDQF